MSNTIRRFLKLDEGLELVEYAVMTSLIVAALLVSVIALSGAVTSEISDTSDTIAIKN